MFRRCCLTSTRNFEAYASWHESSDSQMKYMFYKTKDGSPSVSMGNEYSRTELMHSTDGAFSETLYLYEPIVEFVANQCSNYTFLSVGLGLGYVEMMIVGYFLKQGIFDKDRFRIFSYEKDGSLKSFFYSFFLGDKVPNLFYDTYTEIINMYAKHYVIAVHELKEAMKKALLQNNILLLSDFNLSTSVPEKVQGVFFDAFSAGTSPELWSSEALDHVFNQCDTPCALATYASRSDLKKALHRHGFELLKKQGYGGKKHSTFAQRY